MSASKRSICYVSGTRADFGLMRSTLEKISRQDDTSLSVIVTGMHLDPVYGDTANEIEAAGLEVAARIPVPSEEPSGATMARNIGRMLIGMVDALETLRPDMLLLLGDRGEMLAGALAASHLNIPVAHVAGGDRSGSIDEPVRHATSKLAHIHLTTTQESADRLVKMGERPESVHVVGSPGLDDIMAEPPMPRAELVAALGLPEGSDFILMLFHPIVVAAEAAGRETEIVLRALAEVDLPVVALMPNSDAGSGLIRSGLENALSSQRLVLHTHLPRATYIGALAHAAVLVGNSSSGIVEAASFGTPVVNIGDRQNHRERNRNVIDVPCTVDAVKNATKSAIAASKIESANIFGDGHSGKESLACSQRRIWIRLFSLS